jgi:hypothetical protein
VQIRRVLLLFALVLGLSALVASIAPPPEDREEEPREAPAVENAAPAIAPASVSLSALSARARPPTKRVRVGSRFTLEVAVPAPGDVVLEDLGLRQTADRLAPARFELLATPPGRYEVAFLPIQGIRRVAGRIAFEEPVTVTRRPRGR